MGIAWFLLVSFLNLQRKQRISPSAIESRKQCRWVKVAQIESACQLRKLSCRKYKERPERILGYNPVSPSSSLIAS